MERAEKGEVIDSLKASFSKAQIALCADYRGLTVQEVTVLRRELKKTGAYAKVVKNTLARIALKKGENSGGAFEQFVSTFHGPSFVIFSDNDPVGPAKVIEQFCKGKDKFKVKGAWLDGQFVDAAGVDALSKMPGKAEVLSMLLRVISAPATQIVRLLQAPSEQVVRVIDAQRQNIEKKAA